MDIKTEREAFEAWYCRNHTGLKQSDLAKFRTLSGYSFSDSLQINISWEAWQAAKAQAVPEGFVLMPKEPTPKMIDATWDFDDEIREMSHNTRNEFIYKTMIEALEPTND